MIALEATIPITIERTDIYNTVSFDQSIKVQLLSAEDICAPEAWDEINWNKCLRQFVSNWIIILIQKIIIMQFMPIIIISVKLIGWKLVKYIKCDYIKKI